jgi:Type VI secretion system/phage-baseplate injector OB domain
MSSNMSSGCPKRYYGKYRGKVIENIDPLFLGRLLAEVAAVPASTLNWAMPCVPYAGFQVGLYTMPPVGANVWVEFEGGDPNFPIWSGCFWGEGELPLEAPPTMKVFKTEFVTMILNDIEEEGGFTLECIPPAVNTPLTMLFTSEGITIMCPESTVTMTPEMITLTVPESVITINAEMIEQTVPPSTVTIMAEGVSTETPDFNVTATADISMVASAGVEINAGADMEIAAGGAAELSGGGDVTIGAGGAAELTAGGDVSVAGGGAAEVTAGGAVAIDAAGVVEIAAVGDVSITSVSTMITSLVEVNGDLLIDGQQPIVI